MCDVGKAEYKRKLLRNGSCFNGVDEEGKQIATIFTLRRQLDQFGGNHIIRALALYKTWGLRQRARGRAKLSARLGACQLKIAKFMGHSQDLNVGQKS